jgi:t-SNARE complex subunit (syntaxin)
MPMGELFHMEEFMADVDEVRGQIQQLRDSTTALRSLHSRALSAQPSATLSPAQLGSTDAQRLSSDSADLSNAIRAQIVRMAQKNRRSTLGDPGFEARKKQLEGLQSAFKRALEELFQVEKEARAKARERIERQYKTGELRNGLGSGLES